MTQRFKRNGRWVTREELIEIRKEETSKTPKSAPKKSPEGVGTEEAQKPLKSPEKRSILAVTKDKVKKMVKKSKK